MPPIEARLKDLLSETRLAMLATQLLLGLQYRAAFSSAFDALPVAYQVLDGAALLLILVTAALLLATPSFHQIAEQGHATGRMIRRASAALKMALLPLAVAIGLDVAIGLSRGAGTAVAGVIGGGFVVAALVLWWVVPLLAAHGGQEAPMEDKQQSLQTRIEQILTELRVVLPGVQALFGFQFTATLTQRFDHLSDASKIVHFASLGVVGLAIILLISPAAYHRIAARGAVEERVLRYAVRMMIPSQGLLSLGIVGDTYVTMRLIFDSATLAVVVAAVALMGFAVLLYAVPLAARWRSA